MKIKFLSFFVLTLLMSCKNDAKTTEDTVTTEFETELVTTSIYPEDVTKVFDAHGGIDTWNKMQTLSFTIQKPNGAEVTTTNLKTRDEVIETPTYTAGFDGSKYWVVEKDGNEYKGNAKFYKGLMMYFYAMPFILGDDGIEYQTIEPLEFEGKSYPGFMVSYEAGIGVASNDQYKLFYDAETGQMQWLAYTVTFGKDEKSDKFSYIRYNNWENVNGVVLPKSIDWYTVEDGQPTEKRNTVIFEDIKLSQEAPAETMFSAPEGAKMIE
ncbi:hypothetical protein Q2T40_13475 [Winogradskyella maritima]|uniref:Threonine synthase n=1 Tax=Winogradskyella maritima TaxID=1517766 RepID=A0ABV8AGL1_9FLAO|nr:hypothetical protein [Winogradskyella maritima]